MQRLLKQLPLWLDPAQPRVGTANAEMRRIVLGDRLLHYTLCRARRRTIGLTIEAGGLRVGAPRRTPLREIEEFIAQHAAWVTDKIEEWHACPANKPLAVRDGLVVPLLGAELTVRVSEGGNRFVWQSGELTLHVRVGSSAAALLERALRERARDEFVRRVESLCTRFAIALPAVKLSRARTRWGSCSHAGGIRLNWRLIHADAGLVDYVIAHELAHLSEMNHGPRFWTEVARLYGDYAAARRALHDFADHMPSFS